MYTSIFRTKHYRVPSSAQLVARERLLNVMRSALDMRATLISSPAGTGKSTFLSMWCNHVERYGNDAQDIPEIRVAWLTLDVSDNHLERFVRGVVSALEGAGGFESSGIDALLNHPARLTPALAALEISNALALVSSQWILVLDDLHRVTSPDIHALLTELVQGSPPTLHIVLSTRSEPPLPLNRWRARGWLFDLPRQELYFTLTETLDFLNRQTGAVLSEGIALAVQEQTEGWPVGVRMAGLALRGQMRLGELPALAVTTTGAALDTLPGGLTLENRSVIEYLCDEVLEQQPDECQEFLLCTSILDHICASLYAAILDIDLASAQRLLDAVERENLFLIPLSDPPLWFRYHHQFQLMLQTKLRERYDAAQVAALHQRAAQWLAQESSAHAAVEILTKIGAYEEAADTLEAHRIRLLNLQRLDELSDALALIPLQIVAERPRLLLLSAWLHHQRVDNAQLAQTVARLDSLYSQETLLKEAPDPLLDLERVALQCRLDILREGKLSYREIDAAWLRALPQLAGTCAETVTAVADRCQRLGHLSTGLAILTQALERTETWPENARAQLYIERAHLHLFDCNLVAAEQDAEAGLRLMPVQARSANRVAARMMLAQAANSRHHVDVAEAHFVEVLRTPHSHLRIAAYAVIALSKLIELYAYQGRPEESLPYLQMLRDHARVVDLDYLNRQIAALEAYVALACGNNLRAISWALSEPRGALDSMMVNPSDRIPLIRARVLLATDAKESHRHAVSIVQQYVDYQTSQHRLFYQIEGKVLLACALERVHETAEALRVMEQVVAAAVPNGMIGPFIREGNAVRELLEVLHERSRVADFVNLLLSAYPSHQERGAVLLPGQGAELTPRELEVLRLLDGSLSSKEIADRLTISVNTVRNHRVNILNKLEAHNRVQALARARSLGMLPPH